MSPPSREQDERRGHPIPILVLDALAAGYELILSFPAEHRQTTMTQR